MTNPEFSNEFDILYNNIMSNQAPGLDEYEKSVLLTQAQEDIIKSIYSGRQISDSFEKTEEVRRYLNELINTYSTDVKVKGNGLVESSVFFSLPDNPKVWFITYESAILEDEKLGCKNGNTVKVIPIAQDSFFNIYNNPFRGANSRQVLRLDNSKDIIELISKYNIKSYLVRYIAKPTPIILYDLDDGLTIDGINTQTECKLNPVLHRVILERAIQIASTLYK